MEIFLNGKKKLLDKKIIFIEDLINAFFKERKGVIIEVNGKLIGKDDKGKVKLNEGDRVEIIQFMGGG